MTCGTKWFKSLVCYYLYRYTYTLGKAMTIKTKWTIVHYKERARTMLNTFYIMTTKNGGNLWYMLVVRDTHLCLSSGGDLDLVLKTLRQYVKTYRTKERLLRALSGLDCQGRVSTPTFEQREEYYLVHGEDYKDLIHKVVREAIHEAREEDKINSPLNRAKARLQKAGGIRTIVKTQEVSPNKDSTPQQDFGKIVRKPKVFRHK